MDDANLIRSRIAALEQAIFTLRLASTTSMRSAASDQMEHLRRLDNPNDNTEDNLDNLDWLDLRYIDNGETDDDSEEDLATSLVKLGLAKKIQGCDDVTSGAA